MGAGSTGQVLRTPRHGDSYVWSLRQESRNLYKENGADWPVYGPPHGSKLCAPEPEKSNSRFFFNLRETRADEPEVTLATEPNVH